jgi:catechol 2,3-dioxygenase-like lactoylglutathione lyase family enzyme
MRVHISLPATDLEKSRAFYSELFDSDASKVRDDYLNFRLDEPSIHLSLIASEQPVSESHQHFGIELPDATAFAAWNERLINAKSAVSVTPEPDAQCCYARADKLWLTDPDGYLWEIWHRTGEYSALSEPASTCCQN